MLYATLAHLAKRVGEAIRNHVDCDHSHQAWVEYTDIRGDSNDAPTGAFYKVIPDEEWINYATNR